MTGSQLKTKPSGYVFSYALTAFLFIGKLVREQNRALYAPVRHHVISGDCPVRDLHGVARPQIGSHGAAASIEGRSYIGSLTVP